MRIRTSFLTSAAALSLLGLLAGAALASEDHTCTKAPQAEWKSPDDARAAVEAEGYSVARIKSDHGCYEAYARDTTGARFELLVDPVSLAIVGRENED